MRNGKVRVQQGVGFCQEGQPKRKTARELRIFAKKQNKNRTKISHSDYNKNHGRSPSKINRKVDKGGSSKEVLEVRGLLQRAYWNEQTGNTAEGA